MLQRSRFRSISLAVLVWCAGLACNDLSGLTGKQSLSSGTPNPNSFNTPAGAYALYSGVLYKFQAFGGNPTTSIGSTINTGSKDGAFVDFLLVSGLLTDELQEGNFGGTQSDYFGNIDGSEVVDARQLPSSPPFLDGLYAQIQTVRNSAGLAIGALAKYDSAASPALRGQLYALQGYSIIFLADFYCSGVPLSTLDFNRDFTYHAGSSTAELYRAAKAKFDTAIALSSDSVRIMNFALVGKGRAYLDLGLYDSAAATVSGIPTDYAYQFLVNWQPGITPGGIFGKGAQNLHNNGRTVADLEGGRGLPYRSSGDPRTASETWGNNDFGVPQYAPVKYGGATLGVHPVTVANGIEARLIQAEAAYHGVSTGSGTWLQQLNALRESIGLTDLSDPATDSARVALIFQERAYWLFLTGHRQGDMRRLIRQYNQFSNPDAVYPIGPYPLFGQLSLYGEDVNAPVPNDERINPLFTGCISRGA
jgi:hypothetical protein